MNAPTKLSRHDSEGFRRQLQDGYSYKVWPTGKTWACHARSPFEWFRTYGYETKAEAESWGQDAIEEFLRNDEAWGRWL